MSFCGTEITFGSSPYDESFNKRVCANENMTQEFIEYDLSFGSQRDLYYRKYYYLHAYIDRRVSVVCVYVCARTYTLNYDTEVVFRVDRGVRSETTLRSIRYRAIECSF